MKKLIISYSITQTTYDHLKALAELYDRSASSLIDYLVEREWEEVKSGNLPQPESETLSNAEKTEDKRYEEDDFYSSMG